jgi:hypothetical protein
MGNLWTYRVRCRKWRRTTDPDGDLMVRCGEGRGKRFPDVVPLGSS